MKTFIQSLIAAFLVITFLLSLPYILPAKKVITYDGDKGLREVAIAKGLKPIPKDYKTLLAILDDEKNPITPSKIELGKELYFDTILSKNQNMSCSTCHMIPKNIHKKKIILTSLTKENSNQVSNCVTCHLSDQSGVDRLSSSLGEDGIKNPYHLNTMTTLNSSLAKTLTWAGDVTSMQNHIKNSIESKYKLSFNETELLKRLKKSSKYKKSFQEVFKNEDITYKNVQDVITVYLKTLLTRSSFDIFLEGDDNAISTQAKRGLKSFLTFGCSGCHTGMSIGGQSVQRFPLRTFAGIHDLRPNIEVYPEFKIIDKTYPFPNIGEYKGRSNTQFFRVPILRNVTKTSPYFHNGTVDKINQAVEIMGRNQLGKNLSNEQVDEIVAFFKTLEGNIVDYSLTYK